MEGEGMPARRQGVSATWPLGMAGVVRSAALLAGVPMLASCSPQPDSFLDPGGPIAAAQRAHLIEIVAWTMVAIVPVFVGVPLMLWRYRYRNGKARYTPDWEFSGLLDAVMWGVPFVIVAVLSTMLWRSTYALDPYAALASDRPPLEVQVVGLDWKWLFIYPDLDIATVGEMAFPDGTSVTLDLTTDTVMQSFMISALAGQIYAMPGMRTRLHVLADAPGRFEGENTQFTGAGFAEQKFDAVAMTRADFEAWTERVRAEGVPLDAAAYAQLATSSTRAQVHEAMGTPAMPDGVTYFSGIDPDLFEKVLRRYMQGTPVPPSEQPGAVGYDPSSLVGAAHDGH